MLLRSPTASDLQRSPQLTHLGTDGVVLPNLWTLEENRRFQHVLSVCARLGRAKLLERLQLAFPDRDKEDIAEKEEWERKLKYFKDRKRALKEAWTRDKRAVLAAAASQAVQAELSDLDQARRREEMDKWQAAQMEKHEELAQLRVKKEEELMEQLIAKQQQLQQEMRAQAAAERREAQLRKTEAERLEQHRREKKREEQVRMRQRMLEAEQEAVERERQAQIDAERVEYRKVQEQEKHRQHLQKQKDQQLEVYAKEARLDALRQTVVSKLQVTSDPERLNKPTASLAAAAFKQQQLYKMTGYNTDQLFADKRFRVNAALFAAGLHNSDHGHAVMSAVNQSTAMQNKVMASSLFKN